jgi:hypothetical protein
VTSDAVPGQLADPSRSLELDDSIRPWQVLVLLVCYSSCCFQVPVYVYQLETQKCTGSHQLVQERRPGILRSVPYGAPGRRDGSGLRRTPALVGLHRPPFSPMSTPADSHRRLQPPAAGPVAALRYPECALRLETSEPPRNFRTPWTGLPPAVKENSARFSFSAGICNRSLLHSPFSTNAVLL